MQSSCPKCQKQIDHEDYLFEVQCTECGTRFNPFFDNFKQEEAPEIIDPIPAAGFQESTAAFQEIVEFGEGLKDGSEEPPKTAKKTSPRSLEPSETSSDIVPDSTMDLPEEGRSHPKTQVTVEVTLDGSMLMTSGDNLAGYRIEMYLPPQSVWSTTDTETADPLEAGFASLWDKCVSKGANGVVAMQWRFTPDGGRILLSGTPVRCVKE